MQRRPEDEKTERVTTVLGIIFGAGVGVVIAAAITDTPIVWAIVLGGVLGVGLVFLSQRKDKERW